MRQYLKNVNVLAMARSARDANDAGPAAFNVSKANFINKRQLQLLLHS
jgi:hypothetical protein